MRMILIAVAALLLLGGGGAAAYFFFLAKPAEASSGEEHAEDLEKHAEKKKDDHGDGHGASFEYVELDPLILPIVDNSGVSQTISLVVALEVADAHAADEVKKMTPKLKDAFIQDMYGALNRHAALKGGMVQVGAIKKRLNVISDKVMGDEEIVHDVLLQVVQQRPL